MKHISTLTAFTLATSLLTSTVAYGWRPPSPEPSGGSTATAASMSESHQNQSQQANATGGSSDATATSHGGMGGHGGAGGSSDQQQRLINNQVYKGASASDFTAAANQVVKDCVSSWGVGANGGSVTKHYFGLSISRTGSGAISVSFNDKNGNSQSYTTVELAEMNPSQRGKTFDAAFGDDNTPKALASCLAAKTQERFKLADKKYTLLTNLEKYETARMIIGKKMDHECPPTVVIPAGGRTETLSRPRADKHGFCDSAADTAMGFTFGPGAVPAAPHHTHP